MNEFSLEVLENSKIYVKNNVSFMHPKEIVMPWLDAIKYSDEPLRMFYDNPTVNGNIEGTENIAYPRFMLEVSKGVSPLNKEDINVFGLIVAMDTAPVVKTYSGLNAKACMNLMIFNASHSYSQNLLQSLKPVYEITSDFLISEEAKFEEYQKIHEYLERDIDNREVNEILGNLLRKSYTTKLGSTPITQSAKLLSDRTSRYYFDPKIGTTAENVFQSITQSITDSKEFLWKPEKTLVAYELVNTCLN
jgi:hypothetical protein